MAAAMNWSAKVPVDVKLMVWLAEPVSLRKRACEPSGRLDHPKVPTPGGGEFEIDRAERARRRRYQG